MIVDGSPSTPTQTKEPYPMRKSALFAFAPVAAAVAISYSTAAPSKTASAASGVTLAPSKFGEILVDTHGRTLEITHG
jgi:hypothetical protein